MLLKKQQALIGILTVLLLRLITCAKHDYGGAVHATSGAYLIYVVLLMIQDSGAQYNNRGAAYATSGADINMHSVIEDIICWC